MLILGLAGRKGSGKDTAFSMLEKWCGEQSLTASRQGFADRLKISAARALGVDGDAIEFCDALKVDGSLKIAMTDEEGGVEWWKITGREFLQKYGTEAHREVFGTDFWVDQLLPHNDAKREAIWSAGVDGAGDPILPPHLAVVTDVRFPNEAERIIEVGGQVWEISRSFADSPDDHPSEKPLSPELLERIIVNSKDLEYLDEAVRATAEAHFKKTEDGLVWV